VYAKPKNIFDLIKNAISEDIKNGSLAFLLLTSKSEHYIRDKVALKLYRELPRKRFLVSREWGAGKEKIDLAILRKNNPKVLIEFKLNTVAGHILGFEGEIKKDLGKLKHWKKAHRFIVFMSLLPDRIINKKFSKIVKYYGGFNAFFRNRCSEDFKTAKEEVDELIGKLRDKICKKSGQHNYAIKRLPVGKFYDDAKLILIFWILKMKRNLV
jgi:hypothetical protein